MITFYLSPNESLSVEDAIGILLIVFPFLVHVAGPGALLLSWFHAAQMGRWAHRARSPRQIRIVAVLLGLPLGIVNLLLAFDILELFFGDSIRSKVPTEMAPWLVPAIAGGAGLGYGISHNLKPEGTR